MSVINKSVGARPALHVIQVMKKFTALIVLTIILINIFVVPTQAKNISLDIKSGILIDGNTGSVLWSKNPHDKLPIASTTKIMTAITLMKKANLNGKFKINKEVEDVGESELGLVKGEVVSIEELLTAMMVHSANDAAVALADYTAGNVNKFAALMNSEAKKLGARDSHFTNPDGLQDSNHYSSAYDLALMGRYAMQKPLFKKIVATRSITFHGKKETLTFPNRNKLLDRYRGAIGVKTGYTSQAGFCLVSAANRDGKYLIAVTLGSKSLNASFDNASKLLDFGYSNYKYNSLAGKNQNLKTLDVPYNDAKLPLYSKQAFGYFSSKNSKITTAYRLSSEDLFPIRKDSVQGYLVVKNKGAETAKIPLYAGRSFETPSLWQKATFTFSSFFSGIMSFFGKLSFG